MIAIALELAPGYADAHCVQGMLYSAAGELSEAARAFDRALTMDRGLAIAHGFAGYNAVFLGDASQTLPAIERAMRLDRADRRHSIWFFFLPVFPNCSKAASRRQSRCYGNLSSATPATGARDCSSWLRWP